jgi:transposase
VVYRRSHEIEKRLEEVLRLIRMGGYATPSLAKALGVSIPTVSRCVTALRERGHEIRAEKLVAGWQYILRDSKKQRKGQHARRFIDKSRGQRGAPRQ